MSDKKNEPIPVSKVSGGRETVGEFSSKNELGPTHVAVWEYDWTHAADEDKPKHELGKGHASGYKRKISTIRKGSRSAGTSEGASGPTRSCT